MISFCIVFCNLASLTGIWPSSVGDQLFILSCQIWEDSQLLFKILILPALYTWAFYENMYYVFSMYSCKRTKDISKSHIYLQAPLSLSGLSQEKENIQDRKMHLFRQSQRERGVNSSGNAAQTSTSTLSSAWGPLLWSLQILTPAQVQGHWEWGCRASCWAVNLKDSQDGKL